jgi:hypothetical protein
MGMNDELKQKWIDALRSGEYAQGIGKLCSMLPGGTFEHCCLGVLAEIAGVHRFALLEKDRLDMLMRQDLVGPWNSRSSDEDEYYSPGDEDTHTTTQRRLAAMNDNEVSFREIADYIERTL